MSSSKLLSVIIPVYESHDTLEACLRSMEGQSFKDFELILVDSSPSDRCERIVRSGFPQFRYLYSEGRMLPHAARNRGAELAQTDRLVFTDPDVYADPSWLESLDNAFTDQGVVLTGSISCYGNRWIDRGVHLSKFDLWLPGGEGRGIDICPTINMLISTQVFQEIGGFQGEWMIGDTIFSWKLLEDGYHIRFVPEARVVHHHMSTWGGLLNERFQRGREFGHLRAEWGSWNRMRTLLHLVVTILPLRWLKLIARTWRNSLQAGLAGDFLLTSPVIFTGHAAWLAGETAAFTRRLVRGG